MRRASTHCVKMVVVMAVRLLARVCFRCVWSPSYTAAGINSILGAPHVCCRVRARLTDPASLRCDDQVLAAAAAEEQEEEEEEAAAVVSPSGCALPFARCCCIFVTSYPARGPTRRVHSPFTFVRAPLHCSFLNWPMHFAGALLDMASQPAIVAFASPCLLWAITIITIASSLAFPSRRRRRHRDSPSSLGSTFSAVP